MTITGGTQAVSIALSIVRMKVLALLLGPAGVGVLSIYSNMQSTGTAIAGLGIDSSAIRQIAQTRGDRKELGRVRLVLLSANILQGGVALAAIWLLREPIARWLFGGSDYETEVGLIGVAVLLALLSASQTALLRGMHRIGDLGKIAVLGALAGTVGGVAAVWAWGMDGLFWVVLLQPLTTVLVAILYTRKLPKGEYSFSGAVEVWRIWKSMVQLGVGFMLGGLAMTGTLLVVRGKIAATLGLDAAGQFAAAWGIAVTYIGFLLNAMGMDYYPRLAEVIHDRRAATRLMNHQLQIGLAIGGPVLLLLIGLAPIVVTLLYSDRFGAAVTLLQWQAAGNVFKIASWALSFAVIAAARSRLYLLLEITFLAPYSALVVLFLPSMGLAITGTAFLVGYVIYFATAYAMAVRITGFSIEPLSLRLLAGHGGVSVALLGICLVSPMLGAVVAVILFFGTAFIGGHILLEKIGTHRLTAPFVRTYAACGWPVSEEV